MASVVSESVSTLSAGTKTGMAIMAALVIYLIAENRLGVYLGIITGAGGSSAAAPAAAAPSSLSNFFNFLTKPFPIPSIIGGTPTK